MSVRLISQVWERAPYEGGALLVLLGLADYADDNGICWPSVETIARKARLGVRQTQNILAGFKADGVISTQPGGGRGKSNRYTLRLEAMNSNSLKCHSLKPVSLKSTTETLHSSSENPVICDTAIRKNHQEPSKEPSKGRCNRGCQLPEDFGPKQDHRDLAEKLGVDLDNEFASFADHHLARGSIFRDWNRALNSWLRKSPTYQRLNGKSPSVSDRNQQILDQYERKKLAEGVQ